MHSLLEWVPKPGEKPMEPADASRLVNINKFANTIHKLTNKIKVIA
ncbi:hypothetical protein X474_03750 [Dethiosulfatarculus sandiegensis]|uniref:Uncharacterized protein n=1 Tax=Dethiosulfatarculus sandiegensis TaxID=1429043 RepID=A0A0D2JIB2_9BACT|nr:hypothetical protein X474_03750 [Dethiosulfatarculus sandiegensis]